MHKYRSYVLPVVIVAGIFFHQYITVLEPAVPYLVFIMLLLSFSSLDVHKLKITGLDCLLILFQLTVSIVAYLIVKPFNIIIAQGLLLGIICPVAAASVVVSSMLGANKETITTYNMVGNLAVAIFAPLYFSLTGINNDMPFTKSFILILSKMAPVIVLPFITIVILQRFLPKVNNGIKKIQNISFYLWAITLMIVISQTISFIYLYGKGHLSTIIWLSVASLIVCIVQFSTGRLIGRRYGDAIAGGQALGQKNTAIAIWMASTYLNPLTSIYPAAYSIWQNLFNSYQLYRHDKDKTRRL